MEPARPALLVLQKAAKFRETAGPATLMPVARRNIEELLVQHAEFGTAARGPEAEGHQRFSLRRALPRPREHQFAVRLHFPVHAADVVLLAIASAEDDVKATAHPHIGLRQRDFSLVRPEPLFQRLRLRPRPPDFFRRDGVDAGEGERRLLVDLAGHGVNSFWWYR